MNTHNSMNNIIPFLFLILFNVITVAQPATDAPEIWITQLIAGGWTQSAATAVIGANHPILSTEQPQKITKIIGYLAYLGSYPLWVEFLERHPEAAILAISTGNRDRLYRFLHTSSQSKECWPLILQQYAYLKTITDADDLTQALDRHHKMVCQLAKAGVPGGGIIFIVDKTKPGASEYVRWLEQALLQPALDTVTSGKTGPSEALATAVIFAMTQGPIIRTRMAQDPLFLRQFSRLWEALNRAVGDQTDNSQRLLIVAMEPFIWDLLLLDRGEAILKNWGPEVPTRLLFSPQAIPRDLQPMVLDALFQEHTKIVELLQSHLGDQNLYNLMWRTDLSADQMRQILQALDGDCPGGCPAGYVARLSYFRSLPPSAINSQFAKPVTGTMAWMPGLDNIATIDKLWQGRKVNNTELAMLVLNVVGSIVSLGTSGLLLHGAKTTVTVTVNYNVAAQSTVLYLTQQAVTSVATQTTAPATISFTIRSLIPAYTTLQHGLRLFIPIAANTATKAVTSATVKKAVIIGAKSIPNPVIKAITYAPDIYDAVQAMWTLYNQ